MVLAGWFAYAPALAGGWVWDDSDDVLGNPLLRSLVGLRKIWFEPWRLYDFYPLKYSVQWVQWQLWQDRPFGYHVTSVVLHLVGALMFWRVLRQLGLRLAWVGALVFAIHPLTVESVAWISELKNTLALPPLLLAVSAFIEFEAEGKRAALLRSVAWFLVTMLCKTSAAMLPVFLLLYFWWKRGRLGRSELLATLPHFAVSLALGLVTIWFQKYRGLADEPIHLGGVGSRLTLAGVSAGFYFRQCVWPARMIPLYPPWKLAPLLAPALLGWAAVVAAAWWGWRRRATWGRHALLAGGWFFLALGPAIGVLPISFMHFSWVMDHIAYLALLGVVALGVAGLEWMLARAGKPARLALIGAAAGACAWLAISTRVYGKVFHDGETLWAYTVAHNPHAAMAHNNLSTYLLARGQTAAAREHLEIALRLIPDYPVALKNQAGFLHSDGDLAGAEALYRRALALKPSFDDAHVALGYLLTSTGRASEAAEHYRLALKYYPENHAAYHGLGLVLRDAGHLPQAIAYFEAALTCQPDFPEAHNNLAATLRLAGRVPEAIPHYVAALRLRPDAAEIHFNFGNALQLLARHAEAVTSYENALRLRPGLAPAHFNLALSLHTLGRDAEARPHATRARELDPSLPDPQF
ncbi:MAG: hypothetical protein RLZZ15_1060 [Verrucomicrobiota bacterium]